jgi:hypothetical protein
VAEIVFGREFQTIKGLLNLSALTKHSRGAALSDVIATGSGTVRA